jgi:glycosyltransferase involved in cell wall biosynthesis
MSRNIAQSAVHIVERMAPGGIETLVLDLVRHGEGAAHVFSLSGGKAELLAQWPALRASEARLVTFGRRSGTSPALPLRLAARLRALRPRSVFVHHIGPLLYGGLAARLARVPVLVHVEHDAWHYEDERHRRLAAWGYRLLRPASVAVSGQIRDRVQAFRPWPEMQVVPPGVDMARFRIGDGAASRARLGLDPRARVIGTVGRLVPVKGHGVLIEALAALPEDAHLVLAGDGPERPALEALAARLGLGRRVTFLGHRDDPEAVLPAFDVFCLPSLAEGLPRSVLEAQACGVPVVASDVGGLGEAVCPHTGRLVVAGDGEALPAALASVLARPRQPDITRAFIEGRYSLSRTLAAFRGLAEGGA